VLIRHHRRLGQFARGGVIGLPVQARRWNVAPRRDGGRWHAGPQVNYTLQYWQLYRRPTTAWSRSRRLAAIPRSTWCPTSRLRCQGDQQWQDLHVHPTQGHQVLQRQGVTVADVLGTFQRLFKVSNPTRLVVQRHRRGPACVTTPATCTLKGGVVVNAATNSVVFNLIAPDAEFLDQLAVPSVRYFRPTHHRRTRRHADSRHRGLRVHVVQPNSALIMKRNPYFKVWSAAAQPQGYPTRLR